MASIGHPLLGDGVYGGDRTAFEAKHRACIQGQCLHAGELLFEHPITGKEMHLTAPMSQNMKKTVSLIFGNEWTEII
jgi:23S rRNA-/tRNA-specific pseudouridylate synthase